MKKLNSTLILEVVIIMFWASEYAHVPYFTPYLSSLELGASVIGLIVASYGFTQMVLRIPVGIATDASGRYKLVIILGLLFTTVSSLLLFLTTNPALIFFCRVLAGAASATWIASTVAYMARFPESESVRATARLNALNNAGKLLAFVLGGAAAVLAGYRVTLFVSFAAGLVGLVLVFFIEKVDCTRTPLSLRRVAGVIVSPRVLLPSLLMAVQQMVLHATVFSFTSNIAKDAGASSGMLSVLSVVFTAVQIAAARIISSPVVRNSPRNRTIAAGFALIVMYLLLLGFSPGIPGILAGQVIAAVGFAMLTSLLLAECVRGVPAGERSTVVGTFQAVYGLGMTVGPILMGALIENSTSRTGCVVFALVTAITSAAVLLFWRRTAD